MTFFPADTSPWKHGWVETLVSYPVEGDTVEETIRLGYWRIENPGKPKLVFLHGWAEYSLDMARLAGPFFKDYDILALDARAHGLSDGPPSQYTLAERVEDIYVVLTALNFQPDVYIGHSLGANCIVGLSLHHPEMVKKAVLLDPSWNKGLEVMSPEERDAAKEYWSRTITQWERFSEKQLLRFAQHSFPEWNPADQQRWVEGKKMIKRNTLIGYGHPAPKWDDYIDLIPFSGIVVMGDVAQGALVTQEIAEISRRRWKGMVGAVEVKGADHYVHHYDVDAIQDAIRSMIAHE